MNHRISHLCLILLLVALCLSIASAQEERITVSPADNGTVLNNPGMGWVFHYYDNNVRRYGRQLEPSDTLDDYPGLNVIYLRLAWAFIEPEEGRFNWSVVDAPAQRWIDKGKQVAFRFSCFESGLEYATPKWVQEAGAKGQNIERWNTNPWEPDYLDPIFLEKLENFLAAAAARYDGNPEVAFIDVGSVGVWGEGWGGGRNYAGARDNMIKKHIDLHLKYFKNTLLAANDDLCHKTPHGSIHDRQMHFPYPLEKGLTFRDDSILVDGAGDEYYHVIMAQPFWPKVPVIIESEHYGSSVKKGNWGDGSMYLQSIEDHHGSYASIHWYAREFYEKNRAIVDKINMRLGYRLQLVEASWPQVIKGSEPWPFRAQWRNSGVAPCLPGGFPALTLKDSKGGIVSVMTDELFDMRWLEVAEPGKAPIRDQQTACVLAPPLMANAERTGIKTGEYDLYISVGTRTGTPKIALPLPGDDGQGRYRIGKLKVVAE
ncbi:DUF4832 domain-containing protein [candidate division KSB1 bacterium]